MKARRIILRTIPALAAGSLLLAGCGGTSEDVAESASATASQMETTAGASDAGGAGGVSDGGGATGQGDASAGEETTADGDAAASDIPFIAYQKELAEGDLSDDAGTDVIGKDVTAGTLTDLIGMDVSGVVCDEDLRVEPDASTQCRVGEDNTGEGQQPGTVWTAYPVQSRGGGSAPGLVFFQDTGGATEALDAEEVSDLTGPPSSVSGLGFGSMYLAETIPADQLSEDAKSVLNNDLGDLPKEQQFASVTCEEDLVPTNGEGVECDAVDGGGNEVELMVYPGYFVNSDSGLFVVGVDQA